MEVWAGFQFAESFRSGQHGVPLPWASLVSCVPVLLVLLWRGEFSFFDCLKDRGSRTVARIVFVALIPVAIGFAANLIQNPGYLGLLPKHYSTPNLDLFGISAIGMGLLRQLCLTPTLVKTLADRLNWLWFVGAVTLIQLIPSLIGHIFVSSLQANPEWENSMILGMVSRLSIPGIVYAVVFAFTCLLLLLWSKGDIRSIMVVALLGILQRIFAPPFFSVIGVSGQIVGLFLLWLAVGGMRQLQRSRAMVAQVETPEV